MGIRPRGTWFFEDYFTLIEVFGLCLAFFPTIFLRRRRHPEHYLVRKVCDVRGSPQAGSSTRGYSILVHRYFNDSCPSTDPSVWCYKAVGISLHFAFLMTRIVFGFEIGVETRSILREVGTSRVP